MDHIFDAAFILRQAGNVLMLVIVQYVSGLLVLRYDVRVNYTRKINHFLLFFIPLYFNRDYVTDEISWLYILGAALAVFKFVFYTKPFRERSTLLRTMFRSFDRPEDRPHTLLWLVSQTAAGYLVLIPMSMLFATFDIFELILIPVIIYGLGDGLAEPVGLRFGKHKYRTYALFSNRAYVRSLEGSFVVFASSILVLAAYHPYFSPLQFVTAMVFLPLLMTLTEAFSPHTWDSPTMFLIGYLTLFGISFL